MTVVKLSEARPQDELVLKLTFRGIPYKNVRGASSFHYVFHHDPFDWAYRENDLPPSININFLFSSLGIWSLAAKFIFFITEVRCGRAFPVYYVTPATKFSDLSKIYSDTASSKQDAAWIDELTLQQLFGHGFANFVVEDYYLEWECFMKARNPVTKDTFTEDLFSKYSDKMWWFFPLTCDFLTNLGKKLGYSSYEVKYEVYCFFFDLYKRHLEWELGYVKSCLPFMNLDINLIYWWIKGNPYLDFLLSDYEDLYQLRGAGLNKDLTEEQIRQMFPDILVKEGKHGFDAYVAQNPFPSDIEYSCILKYPTLCKVLELAVPALIAENKELVLDDKVRFVLWLSTYIKESTKY